MQDHEHLNGWIHHSVAITGGFLGVYALLCRADFFGNAQTSNLLYIVTSLLGRNWLDVLIRIGGVIVYLAGIALTIFWDKKWHRNLHCLSLVITAATILLLGFLPAKMDPILGLYPIFFAMAIQWNSFPGARGYVSSSIFSTNNIRQIANSLSEYCITHDRKQLDKAAFFGETVLCFHIGAAFAWMAHHFFAIQSVWCGFLPVLFSAILVAKELQLAAAPAVITVVPNPVSVAGKEETPII